MAEIEEQLRDYAMWLADSADECARTVGDGRPEPAPSDVRFHSAAPTPGGGRTRTLLVGSAAAAAVLVLVVGLAVTQNARDTNSATVAPVVSSGPTSAVEPPGSTLLDGFLPQLSDVMNELGYIAVGGDDSTPTSFSEGFEKSDGQYVQVDGATGLVDPPGDVTTIVGDDGSINVIYGDRSGVWIVCGDVGLAVTSPDADGIAELAASLAERLPCTPATDIDPQSPLADWPTSWAESSTFSTVPLLLPSLPVPGATGALRAERDGEIFEADLSPYHQVWYAADGSAFLEITTRLGQELYVPPRIDEVTIDPWDRAWFTDTIEGTANLTMVAPDGEVDVLSQGLDRDAVLDMARTLTRRADGRPGWDVGVLPPGLVPFAESGPARGSRQVQWTSDTSPYLGLGAEMKIDVGAPESLREAFPGPTSVSSRTVTSINGADAFVEHSIRTDGEVPDRIEIVWSPEPEVVVTFVFIGTRDDALAVASSFQLVDQATWDASTDINTRPAHDGCDSLLC